MSEMTDLYEEIGHCHGCSLAKSRLKVVPGEGPEDANLLFIGEAPGWNENQQGRPFVGPAGQLLEELLASIGLKRLDVYIANVIKCRPPNNRDPLPAEIEACASFLDRQLTIIRPRMIITLGRYSMGKFFPGESIGRIHGVARKRGSTLLFPMYHPAAALHQPSLRKTLEADMLKIPPLLAKLADDSEVREQEQITQLSLF
jgi:DNA polymerase